MTDPAPVEPSFAAATIATARDRLARAARPQTRDPGAAVALIALAERVRAKLPPLPSLVPMPPGNWLRAGGTLDVLPMMPIGSAGEHREGGVVARPGAVGHLVYGPYARLGPGEYRVRLRISAEGPVRAAARGRPAVTIEAATGDIFLAQRQLSLGDLARPEQELRFRITERSVRNGSVEVRVWTTGAAPLVISSITIERRT